MTETTPWVKWRFDRWRGDAGLRMCSLAARGLWIELLGVMHGCEPYGHLSINGRPPTIKQIASLVGMTSEKEVSALLTELNDAGVYSKSDDGLIYSRRLVRDNAARESGRNFGRQGGNPNLLPKQSVKDNHQNAHETNAGLTPPVNTEKREEKREARNENRESLSWPEKPDDGFDAFWAAYPRKDDKGHARTAWRKAARKVPPDTIIEGLKRAEFSPERRFQPLASTWLNGERWSDEPAPQGQNGTTTHFGPPSWPPGVIPEKDTGRPLVNGYYIEETAENACHAAGIGQDRARDQWPAIIPWLQADIPPQAIRETIQRIAERPGYVRPASLAYFDKPIRELRG